LTEELGDLLFQVVFHSQIAAERGEFTIHDVLRRLNDKMVSRHPHVFAGASVETPKQALAQWEALKQREAGDTGRTRSVIDGVPQEELEESWHVAKANERRSEQGRR